MQQPIPTPHDLKDIPQFPFEPTFLIWIVTLIAVSLIIILIVKWLSSSRLTYKTNFTSAIERANSELDSLLHGLEQNPKTTLESVSVLVKRLYAVLGVAELREYTSYELKELSKKENDSQNNIYSLLAQIDEMRWLPQIDINKAKTLVTNIRDTIRMIQNGSAITDKQS